MNKIFEETAHQTKSSMYNWKAKCLKTSTSLFRHLWVRVINNSKSIIQRVALVKFNCGLILILEEPAYRAEVFRCSGQGLMSTYQPDSTCHTNDSRAPKNLWKRIKQSGTVWTRSTQSDIRLSLSWQLRTYWTFSAAYCWIYTDCHSLIACMELINDVLLVESFEDIQVH